MSIWTILLNVLFGLFAGVVGGLGMGGGTILIPLLTIFLGFEQKLAQGINLLSFLVMAIFSLIVHFKNGYVQTKGVWYIILPGLLFSALGAILASMISADILRVLFGVFLCVLAIFQFIKAIKG